MYPHWSCGSHFSRGIDFLPKCADNDRLEGTPSLPAATATQQKTRVISRLELSYHDLTFPYFCISSIIYKGVWTLWRTLSDQKHLGWHTKINKNIRAPNYWKILLCFGLMHSVEFHVNNTRWFLSQCLLIFCLNKTSAIYFAIKTFSRA